MAPKDFFPRVAEARAKLAEKAADLVDQHLRLIEKAALAGNFKEALEAQRWLLEHMPVKEDSQSLVDSSVDTRKQLDSGPKGPAIQIGIAIAPSPERKALPPVKVIDANAESD